MKLIRRIHAIALIAVSLLLAAPELGAQGPLTPPGVPAPTMKSLQEIWNELQATKTSVSALQGQVTALQALQQKSSATALHYATGGSLPWTLSTVDSAGSVGEFTSLAFGPDGQPAISYYDNANGDLEFARFNGSTWTLTTVDSAGSVGRDTSLAFGPDGQPAISYYDNATGDLKFARFNGSTWTLTTLDSTGIVGQYTSLAFGPDGLPAISYYDNTNFDLKFARMGVFTPAP